LKHLAILAIAVAVTACGVTPTAPGTEDLLLAADRGDPVLQTVTGGGRADLTTFGPGYEGFMETYGFTARKTAAGEVSGNLHADWSELDGVVMNLDIVCLSVVGNSAYLGGFVTDSSNPGYIAVGQAMAWKVTDYGEGQAEDDRISGLRPVYAPSVCSDPDWQEFFDGKIAQNGTDSPLTAGHVQILDRSR
jgi:hypothetical protein